jgi:hypothetical protein
MLLSVPILVCTIGYLYATNVAGTVVWATAWHSVVWFTTTFPLLPSVGAPAVGLGWIPAGIVSASIVGRRTSKATRAAIVRSMAVPAASAIAAGAAGWGLASAGPRTLLLGAAGLVTAEVVLFAALWVGARPPLLATYALGKRAVKGARGGL